MGTTESREISDTMTTKGNKISDDDSYAFGTSVGPSNTISRRLQHTKKSFDVGTVNTPSKFESEGEEELSIEPLDSVVNIEMPESGEKDGKLIQLYHKLKSTSIYNSVKRTKKTFMRENTTVSKLLDTVQFDKDGKLDNMKSNGMLCILMKRHDIDGDEEITWYASKIHAFFWIMHSWRDKISDYTFWCMSSNLKRMVVVCAQLEAFLNNDIKNLPKEFHKINIATAQINEMLETRVTQEKTREFEKYSSALINKNTEKIGIYAYSISRLEEERKRIENEEARRMERRKMNMAKRKNSLPLKKIDKVQRMEKNGGSDDREEKNEEKRSLLWFNLDNLKSVVFGSDEGREGSDKKD